MNEFKTLRILKMMMSDITRASGIMRESDDIDDRDDFVGKRGSDVLNDSGDNVASYATWCINALMH